ncbi:hypothetical protein BS50DRAFT_572906 [Corynespora cassiicola Philippines]|uniref:Uncharacterized protein n=1 Tax=Corynespora cassiicola Philippines TaxID=1448308 RepID=A0A2T2NRA6_CORCC|nr:hypothetical protein BS50DRAFT_572906 [Corynespora cassiicola Philippines]
MPPQPPFPQSCRWGHLHYDTKVKLIKSVQSRVIKEGLPEISEDLIHWRCMKDWISIVSDPFVGQKAQLRARKKEVAENVDPHQLSKINRYIEKEVKSIPGGGKPSVRIPNDVKSGIRDRVTEALALDGIELEENVFRVSLELALKNRYENEYKRIGLGNSQKSKQHTT